MFGRTIAWIIPASSSISTNTKPLAVRGRWRATTSPATSTCESCSSFPNSALEVSPGGREPAEREVLVGVIQRHLELMPHARRIPLLVLGREPQAYLPEQLPTREPKAVASAHPDQMLNGIARQLGRRAAHQVTQALEGTAALALVHHLLRGVFAPLAEEREAYADGRVSVIRCPLSGIRGVRPGDHGQRTTATGQRLTALHRTVHIARVYIRQPDLDPVAACVAAQRVERVETHGLVVEQPGVVLDGVVMTQPSRLVCQQPECRGGRLGEAEAGEGGQAP